MNENNDSSEADNNEPNVVDTEELNEEGGSPLSAVDLRNASYFILFIAAIFVVNALETGSYRTPWPVAIIVSVAGLGLLGYSCKKDKDERP